MAFGLEMMLNSLGINADDIKKQVGEFAQIMAGIQQELIAARAERAVIHAKLDLLLQHHGIAVPENGSAIGAIVHSKSAN